jgi:hypothetical protein
VFGIIGGVRPIEGSRWRERSDIVKDKSFQGLANARLDQPALLRLDVMISSFNGRCFAGFQRRGSELLCRDVYCKERRRQGTLGTRN